MQTFAFSSGSSINILSPRTSWSLSSEFAGWWSLSPAGEALCFKIQRISHKMQASCSLWKLEGLAHWSTSLHGSNLVTTGPRHRYSRTQALPAHFCDCGCPGTKGKRGSLLRKAPLPLLGNLLFPLLFSSLTTPPATPLPTPHPHTHW